MNSVKQLTVKCFKKQILMKGDLPVAMEDYNSPLLVCVYRDIVMQLKIPERRQDSPETYLVW